jgi:murein DD-endopeptidase MepM/ murein hydrolase activator NlpD
MPFGVPVFAYLGGTVTTSSWPSKGGYVVIEHPGGWRSQYMHLDKKHVSVGQQVKEGQVIGTVGNDRSSFPLNHLHFQLRYNGGLVDPSKYLQVATLKAWPVLGGVNVNTGKFIAGAAAIVGSYWLVRKYS